MQAANSLGVGPVILSDGPEPRWQHGFGIEFALQTGAPGVFCFCSDTSQLFAGALHACGVDLQSFVCAQAAELVASSMSGQESTSSCSVPDASNVVCLRTRGGEARPYLRIPNFAAEVVVSCRYHVVLFCAAQVIKMRDLQAAFALGKRKLEADPALVSIHDAEFGAQHGDIGLGFFYDTEGTTQKFSETYGNRDRLSTQQRKYRKRSGALLAEFERVEPHLAHDAEILRHMSQLRKVVRALDSYESGQSGCVVYGLKDLKRITGDSTCGLTAAAQGLSAKARCMLGRVGVFN